METVRLNRALAEVTNRSVRMRLALGGLLALVMLLWAAIARCDLITGTIAALNGKLNIPAADVAVIKIAITGTWSATLAFQYSDDGGTTWFSLQVQSINSDGTFGSQVNSTTADGQYQINTTDPDVRVIATAYTSGTATVSVWRSGNFNNRLAALPNTSSGALLVGDNSASPSGKVSVLPCRANASGPTWTEGNVVPCSTDLSGNLRVLTANTPSSGASQAISAYFSGLSTQITIKASAGNLYGATLYNTNASACYLDFFDTTTPTLGTTTPIYEIGVAASSALILPANIALVHFSTAIYAASVTASKGSSLCAAGFAGTINYL